MFQENNQERNKSELSFPDIWREREREREREISSTSLVPCSKFGLPYLGKATANTRAALPIPNSACGIFVYPSKSMAASTWDL